MNSVQEKFEVIPMVSAQYSIASVEEVGYATWLP